MEWSFPFLSINGDRQYNDADFARFYDMQYSNGVFFTVGEQLKVKNSGGGLRVIVSSGAAMINGRIYFNSEDIALEVPISSNVEARKDSVVLRLDLNQRDIKIVYKKDNTDVQRSEQIHELQLATIEVGRSASNIYDENITDMRAYDTVCGYASPYEKISASGLEDQYRGKLERAFESFQKSSADDLHILQTDFQKWFKNLQDQLTSNQAGNIQNQLDGLIANETVYEITHSLNEEYPTVQVLYWEYGLGTVPLENQPADISFDGEPPHTVPTVVEYPHSKQAVVKVPLEFKMTHPMIEKVDENKWFLLEGKKSMLIRLGGN